MKTFNAVEEEPKRLARALGSNVRMYRKLKGYQQNELAKILDVSPNYISQVESGKKYPSLKTIAAIAHVLDVAATDLLANDQLLDDVRALLDKYDSHVIQEIIKKITSKELHQTEHHLS